MKNIEFKTDNHAVEILPYLPRKYAKEQLDVLLEGVKISSNSDDDFEVSATAALSSMDVIVKGMVVSLDNDSNNVFNRLQELPDQEYSQIAEKCAEIRESTLPKVKTTSNSKDS